SWFTLGPAVRTSMKCMQALATVSPAGVHDVVAAVQNLPSRKTASISRASPVSIRIVEEPFCFASCAKLRLLIVRSVVATLVPFVPSGTPVSDQRVRLVGLPPCGADAMKSVEVDERLFAGMIGKVEK